MKRLRPRLTYANVVSTLALFLVLGGGVAFAAKKLTTNDIKKGAIKTKLLAKKAVTNPKLAKNSVKGTNIAANSIDGSKVLDKSLTPADLAGGASVIGGATGGPLDVPPSTTTPMPLNGGAWTQGATENDLFIARLESTVQAAAASTCFLSVTFEVGGVSLGSISTVATGTEEVKVAEGTLFGARLATGSARPSQLTATASSFGIPEKCKKAHVDAVKVTILGIG
jgi:hypothetical protein